MLQWPRSPRSHPKNPRFSNSVSSRSVFARRRAAILAADVAGYVISN
jgi:hypothetical protein